MGFIWGGRRVSQRNSSPKFLKCKVLNWLSFRNFVGILPGTGCTLQQSDRRAAAATAAMGCAVSKSVNKEIEYNVEEQDLTSLPFASIPKNVSKITCANNKIRELPAELSTLSTLKEVDASTNALTTIPEAFSTSGSIEVRALSSGRCRVVILHSSLAPSLSHAQRDARLLIAEAAAVRQQDQGAAVQTPSEPDRAQSLQQPDKEAAPLDRRSRQVGGGQHRGE